MNLPGIGIELTGFHNNLVTRTKFWPLPLADIQATYHLSSSPEFLRILLIFIFCEVYTIAVSIHHYEYNITVNFLCSVDYHDNDHTGKYLHPTCFKSWSKYL